jgi:hypothetical protein
MRRASLRVYLQSNSDGSDKIIIGGGPLILQPLQQLRQLGEVGGEPPRASSKRRIAMRRLARLPEKVRRQLRLREHRQCELSCTGFNVWQQPTAIAVDITAPKGRVGNRFVGPPRHHPWSRFSCS